MNLNKYIYAILVAGILAGCSKLKDEPYGYPSTDNFYKSEEDANSAIHYAYSVLPEIEYYSRTWMTVTELPTENLSIKADAGASNFELDELRTRSDNPDLLTTWRYAYIGINRANAVIANVPGIQNMGEAARNQIVGEAYFLRALHYFNLVRMFDKVIIRTAPITKTSEVNAGISPREDVYALIVEDLKKAEELMDMQWREGRANKVASWALLSKVHLFLASARSSASPGYEFVGNAEEHYAQAKTYSGKVLTEQSIYRFDPNLRHIWNVDNDDNRDGLTEHIFSVSTDRSGELEGNYSKLPLMFIPYIDGASFKLDDGITLRSGWNHFITEPAIYNSYSDADKRKTELIVSKVWLAGQERRLDINGYSRPFTRKYIDPQQNGDKTSVNTPVLRYSDILLVFAEASGPSAEGYEAINQVRRRAGLEDLTPGMNVQQFRDAVIQERAWELAFEGDRLFDLRRTNTVEKVLEQQYGKNIISGAYFFSIPQREIDTNPLID